MLAGRASTASREIKDLLSNSVTQIQESAKLVNESGRRLEQIVVSIDKVAEWVEGISYASVEQSQGIAEINTAISGMDDMTQRNSSLVVESAAAAQAMTQQAARLAELVQFFRTK